MKSLNLTLRTDRFSHCSYCILLPHTQGYDCNLLSTGQTSYCKGDNKIMTSWQIYFTAKVCCSSPLISLFLFFLSVILQEANKTDAFNDKQRVKGHQFKNKTKKKTASQRSFWSWQPKLQKMFRDLPAIINWRMWNINNFSCFGNPLKSVPLVLFLITDNLRTGKVYP